MRRRKLNLQRYIAAGIFFVCFALTGAGVQAEEVSGYYDEAGNWIEDVTVGTLTGTENGSDEVILSEVNGDAEDEVPAALTGSYSVPDGWAEDTDASTAEKKVYTQGGGAASGTSTIACSYLDTNYSVLEYEQLRDMLTNSFLYSNVNVQISTSAVYTLEKDYLYILIVDDSQQAYRDIYHYVVGDYRCFCVEVREYRAEAEQAKSQDQKAPQQIGQAIAEGFTWDSF